MKPPTTDRNIVVTWIRDELTRQGFQSIALPFGRMVRVEVCTQGKTGPTHTWFEIIVRDA